MATAVDGFTNHWVLQNSEDAIAMGAKTVDLNSKSHNSARWLATHAFRAQVKLYCFNFNWYRLR
jgi:hypothetical protein